MTAATPAPPPSEHRPRVQLLPQDASGAPKPRGRVKAVMPKQQRVSHLVLSLLRIRLPVTFRPDRALSSFLASLIHSCLE